MNKQNPNKRGIETLLSDEELLGYMLAPERRDFARREHKRVRREIVDLEVKLEDSNAQLEDNNTQLADAEAKLNAAKSIPKRGGEANAARYKPIHDLVREVHAECSANLLPQHEWMSFQSSENSDQLNEIYKKVRPRFKVFAAAFHNKARDAELGSELTRWLASPAAESREDSSLHKWWKERNKQLKEQCETYIARNSD